MRHEAPKRMSPRSEGGDAECVESLLAAADARTQI